MMMMIMAGMEAQPTPGQTYPPTDTASYRQQSNTPTYATVARHNDTTSNISSPDPNNHDLQPTANTTDSNNAQISISNTQSIH